MSKTKPKQEQLPPTIRAILAAGGSAEAARKLGAPVTSRMVEQWLRRSRTPVVYIRRLSGVSGVSVDEFLSYEEQIA